MDPIRLVLTTVGGKYNIFIHQMSNLKKRGFKSFIQSHTVTNSVHLLVEE